MKVLLHACCGPCLIYPASILCAEYSNVTAYFFNPNIHPYKEFSRRKITLTDYCKQYKIPLVVHDDYGLKDFLRKTVFKESIRCSICYSWRLETTAKYAASNGYSAFSSTLLYSRYQNHERIQEIGNEFSKQYGVEFLYRDFRVGWEKGIIESKSLDMYRQPYCGCVYSEQERYDKSLRKKKN